MFKTLSPVLDLHAIPCLLTPIPTHHHYPPLGCSMEDWHPQVREDQTVLVKRAGPFYV